MEKEYIVELRITADEEEIEKYGGIENLIYETTEDVPFSFDIEDCREVHNCTAGFLSWKSAKI